MEWPLLAGLDDADRGQILGTARRRRFARGEVICHEGDPADSMHLVAAGRLAVRVTAPSGEKAMINLLTPGDYFGEMALVRSGEGRRRSATVLALEPAETLSLTAPAFRDLCRRHPSVERFLVVLLAERVDQLSGHLLDALYVGLDRRVYRALVDLSAVYDDGHGSDPTIALTQEQLADLVGGTRPSVNQVLQRLAAQGIVRIGRGNVVVTNGAELRRKAQV